MPRYFFNVRDSLGTAADRDGLELPDPAAAHAEALRGARSLLSEEIRSGELDLRGRIDVIDENGSLVETLHYRDVVAVHTGSLPGSAG